MSAPLAIAVGDVVRLRKPHPCGGAEWRVTRVGADIGLLCLTCERRLMLERRKLEGRIKEFVPAADAPHAGDPHAG